MPQALFNSEEELVEYWENHLKECDESRLKEYLSIAHPHHRNDNMLVLNNLILMEMASRK